MLRLRVLTALLLAPLVVWATLGLPSPLFSGFIAVVISLGAWEWSRLVGLHAPAARATFTAAFPALMAALHTGVEPFGVAVAGLLWWLAALVWVKIYPAASGFWLRWPSARAVAGALVLLPAWASLDALHRGPGPGYVLLLLLLIWGADTGAYFAGRRWGRHKLAPRVSPGKSWEGVVGGLTLTALLAAAGGRYLAPPMALGTFVVLCLVTVGFSVLGDLTESMFKRVTNVKDSGALLPGHGGVLDRIDSLTAAAPVFLVGYHLLETVP